MLFILVQIQAGPPAFAGSASYGSASPVVAKPGLGKTPLIFPKIAVDGLFLGVSRVRNLV
jgi:hypothetical protein